MGVGISFLIGLNAACYFSFFKIMRFLGLKFFSIPFLYGSLISFLVSIASHSAINLPNLLCKHSDGTFPIWSLMIFGPYLYLARVFLALRRKKSGEPPYSEIVEGLYVGGWPSKLKKLPPGNPAIIDCTCELPRKLKVSRNGYLCIPIWDTRSPKPVDIESAVKWACIKRTQNVPVFIHCAYGHGRSVAVMCGVLVALGVADDWKIAEKLIKAKRPYIHMNSLHRYSLEEWSKNRFLNSKMKPE